MRAVDGAASGDSASDAPASAAPTPVPDGEVRTSGLVTVLDNGEGPQLCLGAVAESYPPQCGGPELEDFDFGRRRRREGRRRDVGPVRRHRHLRRHDLHRHRRDPGRALRHDGASPRPAALEPACDDATTTDADKATPEDMDATLAAASALPTYATAWLSNGTISVAVTEDPEGAEAELRKTWGGLLCVTTVEKTDADLNAINQELQGALGEQLLTSGSTAPDSLDAQVVFDDGSIQDWADATYGEGLVRVSSALEPDRLTDYFFSLSVMLIELMQ